ncbi:MAG: hypothetical protein GY805_24250 [Chloroflexi bacterium]|nr:hypothetical protein [Chloroflexota bacterium]
MSIIQKVQDLLTVVPIRQEQGTAVEPLPTTFSEWISANDDLIPAPDTAVSRVTRRIIKDGNITILEEITDYEPVTQLPSNQQVEERQLEPPTPQKIKTKDYIVINRVWRYSYEAGSGSYFQYGDGTPLPGGHLNEIYEAAADGRLIFINTIPNVPLYPHEIDLVTRINAGKRLRPAKTANGRLVLQY